MTTSSLTVYCSPTSDTATYIVNGKKQPTLDELNEVLDALIDLFNDVMYLGVSDECDDSFQKASKVLDKFERVS